MLQVSRRILLLWAILCLLPITALCQLGSVSGFDTQTLTSIIGRVTTATGDPVRGAIVQVTTNVGAQFRSVVSDNQGKFSTNYHLSFAPKEFIVTVTVMKKGYPIARGYANYGSSLKPIPILVVLRPPQNDPTLLPQADLISGLAPKLRKLDPSDGLPEKDLKNYERGVGQFLDRNRVDLAVLIFHSVVASNPACLRCRVMLGLAELKWGDWLDAERQLGESVNAIIANRKLTR